MSQDLKVVMYDGAAERKEEARVNTMIALSAPFTLSCRNRRTGEQFEISSEFMTAMTITFSAQEPLDPGDILEMSLTDQPGSHMSVISGQVISCLMRGTLRFTVFEGLIQLFYRDSRNLEKLRDYAGNKVMKARDCA